MDLYDNNSGQRLRDATLHEALRSAASPPDGVFRHPVWKVGGPRQVYVDGVEPEELLDRLGIWIAPHLPDSEGTWWLMNPNGTAEVQITISGEPATWGEFVECVIDMLDMMGGDLSRWRGWEVRVQRAE